MEKVDIVLVVLNRESLENVIEKLNFDNANLVAIITDNKGNFFQLGEEQIPILSLAKINQHAKKYKKAVWLIGDYLNDADDIRKMKKFLTLSGVPENTIVNFEVFSRKSEVWLANLHHVEKHGADFFATGNEFMRDGLNLKFIPTVTDDKKSLGGVNLSDANQSLYQSYMTAKYVFEHVERGTIKFVLIGLSPESFFREDEENSFDFQHFLSLAATTKQADLNFDEIKETFNKDFSAKAIADWQDTPKSFSSAPFERNLQILKDYIKLCLDNGAKPVGIIFPVTPVAKKLYAKELLSSSKREIRTLIDSIELNSSQPNETPAEFLDNFFEMIPQATENVSPNQIDLSEMNLENVLPFAGETEETPEGILDCFRAIILQLEKNCNFPCVNMFDIELGYAYFCDMTHLNKKGMTAANSLLALKLCNLNLIPTENFCEMNYEYLYELSNVAPKDEYNSFMERVFNFSVREIRRKDKIKIGFVVRGTAEWCGDELYNLFVQNERFEVTVFCYIPLNRVKEELFKEDFLHGIEQFKQRGLNVISLSEKNAEVPPQDLFIFLTPYFEAMPVAFRPENTTAKTLMTFITYSFMMSIRSNGFYNRRIFRTAWKVFFSSPIVRDLFAKKNSVGLPRGFFSGYPRTDIFFHEKDTFRFDWKMTRPDAKKILWAPHWSINSGIKYATFQWNCEFMYEFAKAHPETSWTVKPHPLLFSSAYKEKVFPSPEAFKEYLQKWDDLPNAQVYTGGYYQAVFATSDGMIQDCSSFIAEYQFVDKPMIYLTRQGEKFNELADTILNVSYTVDGKNFDGIAALMKKVFIDGDDYKAAERKAVFDKYLNYPKLNGMSASKFIYKSISDELKGES